MAFDKTTFSIGNALGLLNDLPADLIPGAVRALAYRAAKCPVEKLRDEYIQRLIEVAPRCQNETRDAFNRGRADYLKALEDGYERARKARPAKPWDHPGSHRAMPPEVKAARNRGKVDKLKAEALRWRDGGKRLRDFEKRFNIHRKDRTSLPGIMEEIRIIWERDLL